MTPNLSTPMNSTFSNPLTVPTPTPMPPSMPTPNSMTTENIEISFTEPRNSEILSSLFGGLFQQPSEPSLTLTDLNSKTEVLTFNLQEGQEPVMCPICRVNFQENDVVRKINHCNHMYHLSCIDNYK